MAEVLLFHHALGVTEGLLVFAHELRDAGHTVHVPDLFEGRTFDTIETGVGYAGQVGWGEMIERGEHAARKLSGELVYAGLSLGVMPAQKLAQTRAGAQGALFFSSCLPAAEFGGWPRGLPLQVHGMDADPIFMEEGDVEAARELLESADEAELFLYSGREHYFMDSSLPSYDARATRLLTLRVLEFLARRDGWCQGPTGTGPASGTA